MHLLVPRSRSSAKVKVKYKGYISQKMAVLGAFLFRKHILFVFLKMTCLMEGFEKNHNFSQFYMFQFDKGEKRNALVVELYKDNADLMDALYKVEGQKKEAVSRCYKLEDQCNHLKRMLKKMAVIAVKK